MPEWYVAWAAEYGAMFGMDRAEHGAMFEAWWKVFALRQYTHQELERATLSIAGRSVPLKWRDDHLAEINATIGRIRTSDATAAATAKFEAELGAKSCCEKCSDTGMVIVPHPRFVTHGVWEFKGTTQPTAAVVCPCYRGRAIVEAQMAKARDKRHMTLAEYEQQIPREIWTRFLTNRDVAKREAILATNATRDVDRTAGPLSKALNGTLNKARKAATAPVPASAPAPAPAPKPQASNTTVAAGKTIAEPAAAAEPNPKRNWRP